MDKFDLYVTPLSDGGPAFPLHNHGAQTLGMHLSGMTLRDYFAAKAMQGIMNGRYPIMYEPDAQHKVAEGAYIQADAMLAARNK